MKILVLQLLLSTCTSYMYIATYCGGGGSVAVEGSVVIAIHRDKSYRVCQSFLGVRICAEEELEIVNLTTQWIFSIGKSHTTACSCEVHSVCC